jgi:hypothetical protein
MKKMYKIIAAILVIGILGAAYGWFFVYNKPHENYSKIEPVAKLEAKVCFDAFAENSPETADWLGQVIQISGTVNEFEQADSLSILVFVQNEDEMFGSSGIRCSMIPDFSEQAAKLKLPTQISIKGYCTGFNGSDLIIEQCVIIKL